MRYNGIPGCCRGGNIYDLGSAHNAVTSHTQDHFDERMRTVLRNVSGTNSLTAITAGHQVNERKFLETQGWTSTEIPGYNPKLMIHTAYCQTIKAYLNKKLSEKQEASKPKFAAKIDPNEHQPIRLNDVERICRMIHVRNSIGAFRMTNTLSPEMRRALEQEYQVTLLPHRGYDTWSAHLSIVQLVARRRRDAREITRAA